MRQKRILLLSLLCFVLPEQSLVASDGLNFSRMMQTVPMSAKFADDQYYIWGGSLVKDDKGVFHLYYSRWEKKYGFQSWVTHSEVAHATSPTPFGPFVHQDVALPARGKAYWDGMSTHNPTIHKFNGKYYLYYTGNTGDGVCTETLNFSHRNNQRIGVAVATSPDGPWERLDTPLIDISPDTAFPDALMVSNPSVTMRPDGTFLLVFKAVGKTYELPFGGPIVHITATSQSPTGPFVKQMQPVFTFKDARFPAEDPYIWYQDDRYYAIVKDMNGYFTNAGQSLALFESADGFSWNPSKNTLVSGLTVHWENGTVQKMSHLERPQLYIENGKPKVLLVAADVKEDGIIKESYNIQIPLCSTGISSEGSSNTFFEKETFTSGVKKKNKKPQLILDTDFGPDYDDVGAAAFLHCVADSGLAIILATVLSNRHPLSAPALQAVNEYFNRPQLSIGSPKNGGANIGSWENWLDTVCAKYPSNIKSTEEVPDAVEIYRKTLAAADNKSVTIITIGFLTNLCNLLMSLPDQYSELSGIDLVREKVKELVTMGGEFPVGHETNIKVDCQASAYVITNWPTHIVFSGAEVGRHIKTGVSLIHDKTIQNSPIKDVYSLVMNQIQRDKDGRSSYDQTAVMYAVYGCLGFFELERGRFIVDDFGHNSWEDVSDGPHSRLILKSKIEEAAAFIERRMMHQPL